MKLRSGKVLRSTRSSRAYKSVENVVTSPAETTTDVKPKTKTQTCTRRLSPRNHSSSVSAFTSVSASSPSEATPRSTHNMRLRSGRMNV